MARRRRRDPLIAAALRDLAEFGAVHVARVDLAQRIYRAAQQAGKQVRIEAMPRGWYRVVITDMRPRKEGSR